MTERGTRDPPLPIIEAQFPTSPIHSELAEEAVKVSDVKVSLLLRRVDHGAVVEERRKLPVVVGVLFAVAIVQR